MIEKPAGVYSPRREIDFHKAKVRITVQHTRSSSRSPKPDAPSGQ